MSVRILGGMTRQKMRPAFNRLHAVTLDPATTLPDLTAALLAAEALQDRHRLSEGAVYVSAQRRYLLETGRSWRAQTITDTTTVWTGSDHRLRVRGTEAACSCGARTTVDTPEAAAHWHHHHREGVPA